MAQRIGRYDILKELGEGQFGKVWMATGEVPGRLGMPGKRRNVAIKQLLNAADGESLRLLVQEFSLLDQVKHRSIVRVYEYLPAEKAVVMELVQGTPLRVVIDRCAQAREPIITEAAIEIACEIADALYQAYTSPGDNGEKLLLVHRDLKPENIMLTQAGEVKLLDFGLARVGNTEFAKEDPRLIKGTPIYMAPEQARGEDLDHRADLFSLGLILFELLLGEPAYRAPAGAQDPAAAMYLAIERGELDEALRELNHKAPAIAPVLRKLLNPRPNLRYQTGQDLLVDLRQAYRNTGSYLKDFCSLFFGSIHRLDPLPDPEASGARMNEPEKAPRKSIEDRLREKEAQPEPPPAPRSPVAVVRRAPPPPPAPAPLAPPPTPPPVMPQVSASKAPMAPKIVPRSVSAARPAPPEDDLIPSVKGGKSESGARSANEAGMLQMKPLSAMSEESESAVDPSATAFFAIPPPKVQAPKMVAPEDPPPQAPPVQAQSQNAGPPPAAVDRPAYGQPMGGGIGMGMGQAASSPAMTAAGTPFGVAATPTGNANREKDVESSRVWVLVLGMFGIGGLLTVVVVVLLVISMNKKDAEPVVTAAPAPVAQRQQDTGTVKTPAAPTPAPTPRKTTVPGTSTPKPAPTPAPPPSNKVSVSFSGSPLPTSMELTCPNGYRSRQTGSSASFADVPAVDGCTLIPKGVVTSTAGVRAGRSYNCTIAGTTLSCK